LCYFLDHKKALEGRVVELKFSKILLCFNREAKVFFASNNAIE